MIYYIVSRIEAIDNEIKHTQIGYVTSLDDVNSINTDYENTFGSWITANLEQLESGETLGTSYFDSNPAVFAATGETDCIDGAGLSEITNIEDLDEL